MKVAEGVHQFKIPMRLNPLGYTYCYYISDSGTLIDTGVATRDAYASLENQLLDVGSKVIDIKYIIPTHFHNDHIGLIEQILSCSDAEVIAHGSFLEKQREELDRWDRLQELTVEEIEMMGGGNITQLFGRLENRVHGKLEPFKIDKVVDDSETLKFGDRSLRVFWTPGHAREHICLYDADNRILFSGDHILPKITSHVSMHTYQNHDPLNDYLTSLKKVKDLPVDIILPGHERTFTDLSGRIDQIRAHHKARCDEVKEALHGAEKTIYQIGSRISWDSRPWPQMDFWTKRMAATEAYAHLVYLRNRSEVKEAKRETILYYSI
ncbi:MAG: MBL fold metallo-hydrolase [Candidatus Bathyarchaeota archaeon]|nr:MBL fold metallo-hydrolase [Candidatus Bathyarchaeota archaeon]